MPMHDWTTVPDGIFHAFHHRWISAISDDLNSGRLPSDYYALPEQVAAGLGPDVLTLRDRYSEDAISADRGSHATALAQQARPQTRFVAETDAEFYRRKKRSISVRHVSGDRVVAVLEIVSPGNKATGHAFQSFLDKVLELLEHRVHMLIVDPFPPGQRDPEGVHAAIWSQIGGGPFQLPPDEPFAFVGYECDEITRAYIEPVAVGALLPNMPLFIEPGFSVTVPLEATYQTAFDLMPRRWRDVLKR